MQNRMIDEATLNDMGINGYPAIVVIDEVLVDLSPPKTRYGSVAQ